MVPWGWPHPLYFMVTVEESGVGDGCSQLTRAEAVRTVIAVKVLR